MATIKARCLDMLARVVFPIIGALPVKSITPAHVLRMFKQRPKKSVLTVAAGAKRTMSGMPGRTRHIHIVHHVQSKISAREVRDPRRLLSLRTWRIAYLSFGVARKRSGTVEASRHASLSTRRSATLSTGQVWYLV